MKKKISLILIICILNVLNVSVFANADDNYFLETNKLPDGSIFLEDYNPMGQNNSLLSIIDTDDRIRITSPNYPNSTICYLESSFSTGRSRGTAWMSGRNFALTAAHCVYDYNNNTSASSAVIFPAANEDTLPFGGCFAASYYVCPEYYIDPSAYNDWAILYFNANVGERTGYLGYLYTPESLTGQGVIVRGYAGEYFRQMWSGYGKITDDAYSRLFYTADTTPGQSGAPLLQMINRNYVSIGIHNNGVGTGQFNKGYKFSYELVSLIENLRGNNNVFEEDDFIEFEEDGGFEDGVVP